MDEGADPSDATPEIAIPDEALDIVAGGHVDSQSSNLPIIGPNNLLSF